MNRDTFVALSLVAFALILGSFVALGFGRLVLPFRTAQLLAAPLGLLAFALGCYLLVRAVLSAVGVAPIGPSEDIEE